VCVCVCVFVCVCVCVAQVCLGKNGDFVNKNQKFSLIALEIY